MRRLLIRPGAIGDFLVSLPALEFLRAGYTEVWAGETTAPLARFADRAESLYAVGLDAFGLPGRPENPSLRARLAQFDSIVSWYGARRPEFREAMSAFPVRFLDALPGEDGVHATDYYLAQVGAPPGAAPRLPVQRRDEAFAVIHPYSGGAKKNWPLDRFEQLAARLESHLEVRWTAGPEEKLAGAVRCADLWDLANWLAGARFYVGNDSGITHLAAAAGVPVVALFGPTDPAVWAPRGKSTVVRSPDSSMESLAPETVWNAVRDHLRR